MTLPEVVLTYAGNRWRARGVGVALEHRDLGALDALLADALAAAGFAGAHVRFDLDALPVWLRQYHAHYLNYVLSAKAIVGASLSSRSSSRIASLSSLPPRQGPERA